MSNRDSNDWIHLNHVSSIDQRIFFSLYSVVTYHQSAHRSGRKRHTFSCSFTRVLWRWRYGGKRDYLFFFIWKSWIKARRRKVNVIIVKAKKCFHRSQSVRWSSDCFIETSTPVNGQRFVQFGRQKVMFRDSLIVRTFDPHRKALIHWIHEIHLNRLKRSARNPVNIISTKIRITTIKATVCRR